MADTKVSALPADTTPGLDSLVNTIDDPGGTAASRKTTVAELMKATGLLHIAGGADSAQTMIVGAIYVVDISAYTADRIYTLPAVAAVGDRCGVLLSVGDTAFELLVTAASGDTLNGVAGGTEWSRIFISYECLIFRCIVENATWVVEHDGRIPQKALMHLSTSSDGEAAATFTRPTQAAGTAGVWTSDNDNASIISTSGDSIKTRRAGSFSIAQAFHSKDAIADAAYTGSGLYLNGTTTSITTVTTYASAPSTFPVSFNMINSLPMAVDDFIVYQYRTQAGSLGASGTTFPAIRCWLSLMEILP